MLYKFPVLCLCINHYREYIVFFFFFQAEDGIRDADVTGVQTCALPICDGAGGGRAGIRADRRAGVERREVAAPVHRQAENGRGSGRGRGEISGGAGSLKKKKKKKGRVENI